VKSAGIKSIFLKTNFEIDVKGQFLY